MLTTKLLAGAGIAAALALPGSMSVLADGSATKPYQSVPGDSGRSLTPNQAAVSQVSLGGAAFAVAPGGTIDVSIADQSGRTVSGVIRFKDAPFNGNYVGPAVEVCGGKIAGVPVPDGAAMAFVIVPTIGVDAANTQPLCGAPNLATQGTVTVSGPSLTEGARASRTSHVSQRSAGHGAAAGRTVRMAVPSKATPARAGHVREL
jgi:hypothetical protein